MLTSSRETDPADRTCANFYWRVQAHEASTPSGWALTIENIQGATSTEAIPEDSLWEDHNELRDFLFREVERRGETFTNGSVSLDGLTWTSDPSPYL